MSALVQTNFRFGDLIPKQMKLEICL